MDIKTASNLEKTLRRLRERLFSVALSQYEKGYYESYEVLAYLHTIFLCLQNDAINHEFDLRKVERT